MKNGIIGLVAFGLLICMLLIRDKLTRDSSPKETVAPRRSFFRTGSRIEWERGLQRLFLVLAVIVGGPVGAGLLPPPLLGFAIGSGVTAGIGYLLVTLLMSTIHWGSPDESYSNELEDMIDKE